MALAFCGAMTRVSSYRCLTVWQASMDLADICFEIVETIPHPYRFIFCNQLLRAGISIPSNIAEGSRRTTKGYLNHLSYALGSQAEVETLLEVISRRRLAPQPLLLKGVRLAEPVGKMLHGLVRSLEAREARDSRALIPNP